MDDFNVVVALDLKVQKGKGITIEIMRVHKSNFRFFLDEAEEDEYPPELLLNFDFMLID